MSATTDMSIKRFAIMSLLVSLGTLSVTACWNGDTSQATRSYPVSQVLQQIYTTANSQRLYGHKDGAEISMQVTISPKGSSYFEGRLVNRVTAENIIKSNQKMSQSVSTQYFTTQPFRMLGTSTSNSYGIVDKMGDLPQTAHIGDSGLFFTDTVYSDNRQMVKESQTQRTWKLLENKEAGNNSNNSAKLCVYTNIVYISTTKAPSSATSCYQITPQGSILSSQMSLSFLNKAGTGYDVINFYSR